MPLPTPAWTAVIPLRAGSRGLPGKNIRPLAGRPLYMHAVAQALGAGASQVLISTDIPEVLQADLPAGVKAWPRPPELAGDIMDRGIVLMAEAGIAAGDLKQAYVSNSRFRESQVIFTSDKAAARDAMMRLADRKLALEMVEPVQTETSSPRRSWRQSICASICRIVRGP